MKKVICAMGLIMLCFTACQINVENLVDYVQREIYKPASGEIVLDSSKNIESQLTESGKTYVIRDGFDLGNKEVTIPSNSVLKFFGGTLITEQSTLTKQKSPALLIKTLSCSTIALLRAVWTIQK